LLERYNIAYAIADSPIRSLAEPVVTSKSHAFIRWHGHGKESWYQYKYSKQQLCSWAKKLKDIQDSSDTIYGYFNNDVNAYAPFNAFDLIRMIDKEAIPHKKWEDIRNQIASAA
jgi:uncharacterized protein YecE (DUF72 family)